MVAIEQPRIYSCAYAVDDFFTPYPSDGLTFYLSYAYPEENKYIVNKNEF